MDNNTMHANPFAGTGKVFKFSLKQMLTSKGWLGSTLITAVLLLIGIPLLVLCICKIASKDDSQKDQEAVKLVYVADETEGIADYNVLKETGKYTEVEYIPCSDMDDAIASSENESNAVILRVTKPDNAYKLTVYLPEKTEVSRSKASSFGSFVEKNFSELLMQKANLTAEETELLSMQILTETAGITAKDSETEAEDDMITQIVMMLVPFMVFMTLYMMVLLYGQSMANSVMLEKTSKLMETILTAVHPVALMTGKLLATACAAIIQITVWMIAAAGGLIGTLVVVVTMLPNLADIAQNVSMPGGDTAEKAAQLAESLNGNLPHISVAGIFVTLIVMALGFLLYLAVATVSGAMASKQEDLNKTIGIFSIVLVVSVLVCLRPEISEVSGSFSLISNDKWLRFVPFTALLVLPADLIFGKLTVPETILALFSLAASVMLLIWLAAAVYKLLVLYRGNPPKIRQLIGMLRGSRNGKTDT